MKFLIDTGRMSDFEARSFIAQKYMMLCVRESVPKNVARWLAEHGPGPEHDGEHAKPNDFGHGLTCVDTNTDTHDKRVQCCRMSAVLR